MHSAMILQLIGVLLAVYSTASDAYLPRLDFHHRFSQTLKEKTEAARDAWPFLEQDSLEYHQFLKHRDFFRHGRKALETGAQSVTFYSGNVTIEFLGGIFYSTIDLGTPSVPFLVALDTGSDLLWVPCECKACAPASSPSYLGLPPFIRYAPSASSTSQGVTCSSTSCAQEFSLCSSQNLAPTAECEYSVVYGTPNTSTSGTVYSDVLHLTGNDGTGNATSPIIVGCGQDQTGSLVDGSSVPDGLLGLGYADFTVPSMLAKNGLVGNSFTLCFNTDLTGTLVFGDYGSKNQSTTPFQPPPSRAPNLYYVQLDSLTVGSSNIPVNNLILVDSGTSIAFLESTIYGTFLNEFASQITYPKTTFDGTYDLCYKVTSTANFNAPAVTFNFLGGAQLSIIGGLVFYYDQQNNLQGFCVAVFDGKDRNIFAANIMTGYNMIFNRDQKLLGFEQKNCYDGVTFPTPTVSNSTQGSPPPSAATPGGLLPPAPTAGGIPSTPNPGGSTTTPRAPSPSQTPSAASGLTASLLLTLISLGLVNFLLH